MFAFFQGHSDDTGLGFLRSIRILRPLRSISRVPELKLAVEVLISALPSIGNAMILYAIFIVFASVFFLQLSAESLTHACVGPEFDDLEQVVFCSKEETSCIPGLFRANDCNGDRSACHILHKPIIYPDFENFGVSLLTTFRALELAVSVCVRPGEMLAAMRANARTGRKDRNSGSGFGSSGGKGVTSCLAYFSLFVCT